MADLEGEDQNSQSESTDSLLNRAASQSISNAMNSYILKLLRSLTTDERLYITSRWEGIFENNRSTAEIDMCTVFQRNSSSDEAGAYITPDGFKGMMELAHIANPPFVSIMFEAVKRCADDAYAEMNVTQNQIVPSSGSDQELSDQELSNKGMYIKKQKNNSSECISLRPEHITFFAFCVWYLMMTRAGNSHKEVHSNFGYNMWGKKNAGLADVKVSILLQHIVLTKLDVATDEGTGVESIFEEHCASTIDGEKHSLERLEFCQLCKRVELRIRNWGGNTKNGRMGNEGDFKTPEKDRKGDTVFFGDERWNLMALIMLGIQVCIEKDDATDDTVDDDDDAESQSSHASKTPSMMSRGVRSATISFSGAATMTKIEDGDWKGDVKKVKHRICSQLKNPKTKNNDFMSSMTCYAPELFRRIREAFGISDEDFLMSLGFRQAFSSLFYGKYDGWMRHKDSDGKSGSIFYVSHDSQYMVKTVSHAENLTLRRTLLQYANYVEKNPSTLLMKTLGMFKLRTNGTITGQGGRGKKQDFYLLVLANAFYTDLRIHETYDLKGSKYGRSSRDKKTQKFTSTVYKDLDFVDMKRKIRLQPQDAEDLRAQLRSDSAYLAKNDIIDYSFLIGIHHLHGETRESHKKDWVEKNLENLKEIFDSFKKQCSSKPVVLTNDEGSSETLSPYFAYFTWDDFLELAYSNQNFLEPAAPETPEDVHSGKPLHCNGHKFANFHGGCKASGSPTVYFLAVIDTLVPFEIKKKAEYGVKTVAQHGAGFSVIPPADYSNRFINFSTNCVQATNEKDEDAK